MARDIEEFLRRAAERRKQQQNKKRGPAPSQRVREIVETGEVEIVQPPVEVVKPRRQKQRKSPRVAEVHDIRRQSVEDHVKTHIDSSDIAQHAEQLGDRIQFADDRIAARIKSKFDHDVSRIDDLPSVQDDEAATVTSQDVSQLASDLLMMFRTPQSVRQAILISEILERPKFDR